MMKNSKEDKIIRNLELANQLRSEASSWRFDNVFLETETEYNEYKSSVISSKFSSDWNYFDGVGYYDYDEDSDLVYLVASENKVYTEDIQREIEYMDKPVQKIRARELTDKIKIYLEEVLGLDRYEDEIDFLYNDEFPSKRNQFKRLEHFLKEMRKRTFVFHKEVETRFTEECIKGFKFVYYLEKENVNEVEKDVITRFRYYFEDVMEEGRTY